MITEVRVIYDGGEVNAELDAALEALLEAFGLTRWASGYDLTNGERDLAFERKDDDE